MSLLLISNHGEQTHETLNRTCTAGFDVWSFFGGGTRDIGLANQSRARSWLDCAGSAATYSAPAELPRDAVMIILFAGIAVYCMIRAIAAISDYKNGR